MTTLYEHPIRWLNTNAGFVQALLTVAIVGLTLVTIWDSRKHARRNLTPVIAIQLLPPPDRNTFATISILNAGLGPALDVKIRWHDIRDKPLQNLTLLMPTSRTIGVIPLNEAEVFHLDLGIDKIGLLLGDDGSGDLWRLQVSYHDAYGRTGSTFATIRTTIKSEPHDRDNRHLESNYQDWLMIADLDPHPPS